MSGVLAVSLPAYSPPNRKKSDPKKPFPPPLQPTPQIPTLPTLPTLSTLPDLPNDFRTSLILPDLSRRFSLLRSSSGEPVSVDFLKSRLAEQRARGAENHVSEEEEDMILETLGFRSRNTFSDQSSTSVRSSSATANSSVTSSPGGRSAKRYSNNLFGSGRLRDYSYIRSVASNRPSSSRSASIAPSDSSLSQRHANGLRPVTPDGTAASSSSDASPEKIIHSAPIIPPAPYGEQSVISTDQRVSKSLGSSVFRRASRALEQAIREIEEDVEDEIVMPRSAPIARSSIDQHNDTNDSSRLSGLYEAGTAISFDLPMQTEPEDWRTSPVPSKTLPGYIPGMPRPMTPREDMEHDTLRSHSTTPRATPSSSTPSADSSISFVPSNLSSGRPVHSPSPSFSSPSLARQSPRPTSPRSPSPMFIQRSPNNGRFSPESTQRGIEGDPETSVPGRHRPVSPYSAMSYQPLAAVSSSSRPSTPSNVTWTLPSVKTSPKTGKHNPSSSWWSDSGSGDTHTSIEPRPGPRSLKSPALPDSPILDRGHSVMNSISSFVALDNNHPSSTVSGLDLNSQSPRASSRIVRSPTPTQTASRSPTSPTFSSFEVSSRQGSRRSSKQNTSSSPFALSPYNPVLFSPIANSSRSSLESAGSSYHSWQGDEKENLLSFMEMDSQPPWHDISFSSSQADSSASGVSPEIDWKAEDAEEIISRLGGLQKVDFVTIQEKLVEAVTAKSSMPETRERVPSLRRRRPSTSQSNYSLNGRDIQVVSPPPQSPTPVSQPSSIPSPEQVSKASALLNSVVDSIEAPSPPKPTVNLEHLPDPNASSSREISPTTRRNRDLAQVLFGSEDDKGEHFSKQSQPPSLDTHPDSPPQIISTPSTTPSMSILTPLSPLSPHHNPLRSPSQPWLSPSSPEAQELAAEVQRKTEAAMIALKKPPSNSNLRREGMAGSTRKKINPNQISTPTLVSASTSVDTIPLRSPPLSSGQPSKLGSRFKKLKGTLNRKNTIPVPEVTPYPLDVMSAPPQQQRQNVHYESSKSPEVPMSANEQSTFNRTALPIPSPPASAGPGLKSFMARFRGKQRMEAPADAPQRSPTISYSRSIPPQGPYAPHGQQYSMSKETHASLSPPASLPVPSSQASSSQSGSQTAVDPDESIKQLFDAASNLGLDQQKLSELLVRSGSTSSRSTGWTLLTRNNSAIVKSKSEGREDSPPEPVTSPISWLNVEEPSLPVSPVQEKRVTRKSFIRQPENVGVRRPRPQDANTNTIVRRTLIFPDKGITSDITTLVKKNSRRRRASTMSATSNSSRSVHERVPTPPPARVSTSRRFSNDGSPPVPQLPQSLMSRVENQHLLMPTNDKSNYDSFYEMYAGDKLQSAGAEPGSSNPRDTIPSDPSGPALEVIELANGETIWSIVNGLRDDDVESLYASRASFASEFDGDESMQVFVKDHTRTGSKGSNNSFLSRKKKLRPETQYRPETQVFYSSSAHIGALIENLSQGMDAGTFNFSPNTQYLHSNTSSMTGTDVNLTMEERLEQMLGSMRSP
ncbi:hypothetical protein D9758_003275 [Tetrapyrgos nigripes]|uniref:Uncharacterized protein n=1 Tax=Tetrapyrgos nigripes TaxID=182062 RepID=A0A8H5LQ03_9AGAR|nr:hypothetical protein D9758_003275 [Tetrapyrgos nigripes]